MLRCFRISHSLLCLLSVGTLIVPFLGCSDPKNNSTESRREIIVEEGRKISAGQLLQEPTADLAREFLRDIPAAKPEDVNRLSAERREFCVNDLSLAEPELIEIAQAEYTRLDANYLAEVLLFAELARYLDLGSFPELVRATEAMAWVNRNVYRTPQLAPPVPASYIARRGSGDTMERAYVFMALAQQLGIDTCFIGPPDVEHSVSFGYKGIPLLSPFWAIGALIDNQIYLFDPYSGLPWSADGKEPGTLRELQSNPEQFDTFRKESANLESVRSDEFKKAMVYLAPPLSSLAPRMIALEDQLDEAINAKTAVDPIALRDRMKKATQAPISYWKALITPPELRPSVLAPTPVHVLIQFFPPNEGGVAPAPPEAGPMTVYTRGLLPQSSLPPVFTRLQGVSLQTVLQEYVEPFLGLILNPEGPYSLAARGRQAEAVRALTQVRLRALQLLENEEVEVDLEVVKQWCDEVNTVILSRLRAIREGETQELAFANIRFSDLFLHLRLEPNQPTPELQLDGSAADRRLGREAAKLLRESRATQEMLRTTFRLAICTQERAEWQQLRLDRAGEKASSTQVSRTKAAWVNTADWWSQYLRQFKDADPDRTVHATKMADRASRMARK